MILKHAANWHKTAVYANDSGDVFTLTRLRGLRLKATSTNGVGRLARKHHSYYYSKICVWSYYEGKKVEKNYWVHILVCTAFHGPRPSPTHQVDHIDRDRWNNNPSNLRWVTRHENQMNSIRHIRKLERERLEREKRALLSAQPVQLTINF